MASADLNPGCGARPLAIWGRDGGSEQGRPGLRSRGLWTQLLGGWWAGQAEPCGRPESSSSGADKVLRQLEHQTGSGSFLCLHLCGAPEPSTKTGRVPAQRSVQSQGSPSPACHKPAYLRTRSPPPIRCTKEQGQPLEGIPLITGISAKISINYNINAY